MIRVSPNSYFETEVPQDQVNYLLYFLIGALVFGGICVVAIACSKK